MRCALFVLVAVAVVGCAGTVSAEEPTPEGRTFVSVAVDGEQIPGGGPLTLEFSDGRVSAFAGCNRGAGSADFAGGQLATGELATTMMACPPPFDGADAWMTRLLAARPAWTLQNDTLTLRTPTATVHLQDRKALNPDRPVIDTSWRVESLVTGQAVMTSMALEQSKPGLTIRADQTVTGWTGCNTFYGRAEVTGQTVTFGPLATSGPPCTGEIGEIERSILGVLQGPVQTAVDADRLTLTGTEDHGLVLRAE